MFTLKPLQIIGYLIFNRIEFIANTQITLIQMTSITFDITNIDLFTRERTSDTMQVEIDSTADMTGLVILVGVCLLRLDGLLGVCEGLDVVD